jgi:peptide/nickel transport system substrate-binding protein
VIFTWKAIMNPNLTATDHEPEKYIDRIDVLDSHSFTVHWSESYIFANSWLLEPMAGHILDPILQRDPTGFVNTPYWTREWVGLGPYKLTDWMPGSHLQGTANPDFVLGKPKISQVVAHFVPDANQAVVSMLAGTIDVTLANLIRVEEGLTIKEQMEPSGRATVMAIPTKIRYAELQYRSPLPPPSRDVRARQALLYAMDRGSLVGSLLQGLSTAADMYLAPNDAVFATADKVIAKYPFGPSRAQGVLHDAGWVREGSEIVVKDGERFDLELRTTEEIQNVKEVQIVADNWKQVGVNPNVYIIPKAQQDDQEFRAKFPGVSFSATSISPDWMAKWQSEQAASDANKWRGNNRGAYNRPELDGMYRQYITTIDPPAREQKLVQMVKFASEDVTYLPLYYQVDVHAIRAGLEGLVSRWPGQPGMAFNIYEWYWGR